MLAAEKIDDGSPVNAGREDRITINEAAGLVFDIVGWRPEKIKYDLTKPQGVASRAADLTRARNILDWEPEIYYKEGFEKTIQWYRKNKDIKNVKKNLNLFLIER